MICHWGGQQRALKSLLQNLLLFSLRKTNMQATKKKHEDELPPPIVTANDTQISVWRQVCLSPAPPVSAGGGLPCPLSCSLSGYQDRMPLRTWEKLLRSWGFFRKHAMSASGRTGISSPADQDYFLVSATSHRGNSSS